MSTVLYLYIFRLETKDKEVNDLKAQTKQVNTTVEISFSVVLIAVIIFVLPCCGSAFILAAFLDADSGPAAFFNADPDSALKT